MRSAAAYIKINGCSFSVVYFSSSCQQRATICNSPLKKHLCSKQDTNIRRSCARKNVPSESLYCKKQQQNFASRPDVGRQYTIAFFSWQKKNKEPCCRSGSILAGNKRVVGIKNFPDGVSVTNHLIIKNCPSYFKTKCILNTGIHVRIQNTFQVLYLYLVLINT